MERGAGKRVRREDGGGGVWGEWEGEERGEERGKERRIYIR